MKILAALLVAGADPTLEARISDDVTEDAVTPAVNQMKKAEVVAEKAHIDVKHDMTASKQLRLQQFI